MSEGRTQTNGSTGMERWSPSPGGDARRLRGGRSEPQASAQAAPRPTVRPRRPVADRQICVANPDRFFGSASTPARCGVTATALPATEQDELSYVATYNEIEPVRDRIRQDQGTLPLAGGQPARRRRAKDDAGKDAVKDTAKDRQAMLLKTPAVIPGRA